MRLPGASVPIGVSARLRTSSRSTSQYRHYLDGASVALRVSQPLSEINELASRSRRTALGLLALAVVAAALLATRLAARAAGPVERLSAAAQAMAGGDLRSEVPRETGELAVMSRSLADLRVQMQRRLDELESEQRNMRSVLDGLADAVFLLHDERIVFANSAAGTLFRTPAHGWREQALGDTGLPASVLDTILGALDEEEPWAREWGPRPVGAHPPHTRAAPQPYGRISAHARGRQRHHRADAARTGAP
jgi:HAMP domain-containing protein